MRMRLGLVVGFGAGYYFGAKAGRERYEELNELLAKVRRSEAYETAADKAKAAVELGVERAREVVEDIKPSNGTTVPATDPVPAGGTAPIDATTTFSAAGEVSDA